MVTTRLVVCRVRRLNKKAAAGQDELLPSGVITQCSRTRGPSAKNG